MSMICPEDCKYYDVDADMSPCNNCERIVEVKDHYEKK